jgi:hypothetical protein
MAEHNEFDDDINGAKTTSTAKTPTTLLPQMYSTSHHQ